MSGVDLILEKNRSFQKLGRALESIFNLAKKDILISAGYDEPFLDESVFDWDRIKVWCVVDEVQGDFSSHIALFIRDNSIVISNKMLAQGVATMLDSRCLLPSNSINPFEWILFSPNSRPKNIFLDADELEQNKYIVDDGV